MRQKNTIGSTNKVKNTLKKEIYQFYFHFTQKVPVSRFFWAFLQSLQICTFWRLAGPQNCETDVSISQSEVEIKTMLVMAANSPWSVHILKSAMCSENSISMKIIVSNFCVGGLGSCGRAASSSLKLFKDVRANCFCAYLMRTQFTSRCHTTSCIERVRCWRNVETYSACGHFNIYARI